jgi:hypothetical protein
MLRLSIAQQEKEKKIKNSPTKARMFGKKGFQRYLDRLLYGTNGGTIEDSPSSRISDGVRNGQINAKKIVMDKRPIRTEGKEPAGIGKRRSAPPAGFLCAVMLPKLTRFSRPEPIDSDTREAGALNLSQRARL